MKKSCIYPFLVYTNWEASRRASYLGCLFDGPLVEPLPSFDGVLAPNQEDFDQDAPMTK